MRRYLIVTLFLSLVLPQSEQSEDDEADIAIDFDTKEELYLNFSFNAYRGAPVYVAKTFEHYDWVSPVYALSIGTPFGFQAGFTYTTLNF